MTPPRFNVLGVGVHAVNLDSATALAGQAISEGRPRYAAAIDVNCICAAQDDPGFREILNRAYLCTPDGMPLVWMGRRQGFPETGRVYGPDLMLRLCDHGRALGWRHFFFGGKPGVPEKLAARLRQKFPGLDVAGCLAPPFRDLTPSESQALALQLRACRPHILWVGIGTPKQHRFMAAQLGRLPVPLMIGVGAAFDMHAGVVPQAPPWMQRAGFEWLFRLAVEPARLWRRYLNNVPRFIALALLQITGIRKYPAPDDTHPA